MINKKVQILIFIIFLQIINISYSENINSLKSSINIKFTNEITGLELGTNSRSRGVGSIATGTNSIAIGKNAVATGKNNTKEEIERKLAENQTKLQEIEDAKQIVITKTNELTEKQSREREVIEAGIRVEEIMKAKENAKLNWQKVNNEYDKLVRDSADFLREHQSKIDDLNSKLIGVSNLPTFNINSDDELTNVAKTFKSEVENGTSLNLTVDFYKDYIQSYYKALGDLREAELIASKYYSSSYDKNNNNNNSDIKSSYIFSSRFNDISNGINIFNDQLNFYISNFLSNSYFIKNKEEYQFEDVKTINLINEKTDILTESEYNEYINELDKYNRNIVIFWDENNDMFLENDKQLIKDIWQSKTDIWKKKAEISYYQGEYERTRETTYLDKKAQALKGLDTLLENHKQFPNLDNIKQKNFNKWKQENITSIQEKNKITKDTLTSELEKVLGINKKAIQEKEQEIADKLKQVNQAKTNYENINPTESDLILSIEYEIVRKEIDQLSKELLQANERVKQLTEALTLHDLTDIGKNQIAIGTNTLAIGNNTISLGTNASSVGENSISIGKDSLTIGENSITLGNSITKGDNSFNIGHLNKIYGNNNVVIGDNNTVGTDSNNSSNVYILGSNINATDISNAVILGNNSIAISNAVSVGSESNLRKITYIEKGNISEHSTDAINGSQLYEVAKGTSSDIDVNKWREILQVSLSQEGNLDKANKTGDNINAEEFRNNLNVYDKKEVYNKTEVDNKLKDISIKADGDIVSDTLIVTNGENKVIGNDVKIELKNNSIDKTKLTEELRKEIENKTSIDLDGIISENEERGVKGKEIYRFVKDELKNRDFEIARLNNRINEISRNVNRTAALSTAMSSLDFGEVETGNISLGVGIGHYVNETGISLGIAYKPVNNVYITTKFAFLSDTLKYSSIGASIVYQFKRN